MASEAARHADFVSILRYAQCWEDADILIAALAPSAGQTVLSIASAGENTLALLAGGPERVVALDLNPAQLAALELRVAAFRELSHRELLELMGSRPSAHRLALYQRCRGQLSSSTRGFWDARPLEVEAGIGSAGKFERYFALFRRWVLPLVHPRRRVRRLLQPRDAAARRSFHDREWDTRRWRLVFRSFFSEFLLGRLGRDPSFFRYVQGSVAEHLLARSRHALTELSPAENPYLHWILTGTHGEALPYALREDQFERVRANLDRLEWYCRPIEELLAAGDVTRIDRANLSNIFEYMSAANATQLLERIADAARPGSRLAYWNMLVPRRGAEYLPHRLRALPDLSTSLHERDKAFFYSAFVVEEVIG